MIIDISGFWALNWYYIVAVVLSGTGVIFAIKNYLKKKPQRLEEGVIANNSHSSTNSNTNHLPITITTNVNTTEKNINAISLNHTPTDEKFKGSIKILFIDDKHGDYKMVSILKRAGWTNTKAVKDILDLDNHLILESDIIFVDINGVGTTMFEDQGLGLASALKNKHPKKKIVIYSAETSGDRFHKALRQVDDCLPKNAEPYQFINLVESLSKEVN